MSDSVRADNSVVGENIQCPVDLRICEDGSQNSLGAWALNLIDLGRAFASFDPSRPVTLAIGLPALDFSAVFSAAGFVAASAEVEARAAAARQEFRDALFEQLCSLEKGCSVRVKIDRADGSKTLLGRFLYQTERLGEKYAVIEYYRGTSKSPPASILISRKDIERVQFDPTSAAIVERRDVGKVMPTRAGLAAGFVTRHSSVMQLLQNGHIDCVVTGVIRTLTLELQSNRFEATSSPEATPITGIFQDVVRPSLLLGPQEPSRSMLLPVRGAAPAEALWVPLVIFRGGAAYLHRSSQFPNSHHLVFISPVETDFDVSVAALNDAFLNRSEDLADVSLLLPAGVSAMGFVRNRTLFQ